MKKTKVSISSRLIALKIAARMPPTLLCPFNSFKLFFLSASDKNSFSKASFGFPSTHNLNGMVTLLLSLASAFILFTLSIDSMPPLKSYEKVGGVWYNELFPAWIL
ncbi:hypothetical protein BpHYR1_050319 [Brachionus plicatilis]|uniref:Uncharacterized protein n=1 Tax=Brachionus plicatilis TaxID=10195 RepID=A0A3M7SCL7_BRAPC|nr:hypothetical protein BpHYR1_050319 [Brachionus plicatilis]